MICVPDQKSAQCSPLYAGGVVFADETNTMTSSVERLSRNIA